MVNGAAIPQPGALALTVGEEILRLMQPPLPEEALEQIEAMLERRANLLNLAMEATAADLANGPSPETLRQLAAQQRALEEQARRLMTSMQNSSGELSEARNSMQAVNRILNPGVRPRWVDERR